MARILIVENSAFMKGVLQYLLGHAGHGVVGKAANCTEALEMFRRYKPDLVICDLALGGASGLPVLHGLKAADPGARVIMVHVFGLEKEMAEARKGGAVGFIRKPYSLKEITDEINQALKSSPVVEGGRS